MARRQKILESWRKTNATVRARYAAIAASCLLLAGMAALTVRQTANWILATMPDSAQSAVRMLRWSVNHIGLRPLLLIGFAGTAALLFWLRAGKLDGDLRELSRAAQELADGTPMRDMRKIAGGELGEIARYLERAEQRIRRSEDWSIAAENRSAKMGSEVGESRKTQPAKLEDWANLARNPRVRDDLRGDKTSKVPPFADVSHETRPRVETERSSRQEDRRSETDESEAKAYTAHGSAAPASRTARLESLVSEDRIGETGERSGMRPDDLAADGRYLFGRRS